MANDPQLTQVLYQSIIIGFSICFIIMTAVIYLLNRKHVNKQQYLAEELLKATNENKEIELAHQLLLEELQQSQGQLEEKVQERTLELHITLQELEESNQELKKKNTLDELTGLFNRRCYDEKILAEYRRSKRNLTPLSLVIIDIDHFKLVNDHHGHVAGDQCLIWLSTQMEKILRRSSDMAFRYGGEEFCLILPDTDAKGALVLAQALRQSIEQQVFQYENTVISLTISCGVSTYLQQKNIQPERLFIGADKALYQAKHNGRNQVQVYQFKEE